MILMNLILILKRCNTNFSYRLGSDPQVIREQYSLDIGRDEAVSLYVEAIFSFFLKTFYELGLSRLYQILTGRTA